MKLSYGITLFSMLCAFALGAQTVDEGIVEIEKEDFTGARKIFRDILAKNPKATEPYFYLGETFYQNENKDSAKVYYDKGIAINEDNALCYVGLAKLLQDKGQTTEAKKLYDKAGRRASKKDSRVPFEVGKSNFDSAKPNYEEAINNIQKGIDINPKISDYFSILGDVYLAKKDAGAAATRYESAISKNANDPKNYLKVAKIWYNAKRFDLAEENLQKALAKDPNFAPAMKDLISVYSAQKQFSKATPYLERYVALVGTDVEAKERLVKFLVFYAKDYTKAIAKATELLTENPKNASMLRWITWAQVETKDYENALANSKKFFENVGERTVYAYDYENAARAAKELKKFDVASENYLKIATVDSTRTDVYDLVAKMYYDNKDYKNAALNYDTKAKKGLATNTDYYYLGVSQYYSLDYKAADTTFTKLNKLSPTYVVGYNWKAKTALKLDSPDAPTGLAIPTYEKMIEVGSKDATKNKDYLLSAYGYVGEFYYNKGDYVKAVTAFEKLVEFDPANTNYNDLLKAARDSALSGSTVPQK